MNDNNILKLTESVSWIGVKDYDIRTFDIVMETKFGTTYNSYLINADKKAIVETAKEKFTDTYINNIKQIINPADIDFIVINHTEPDHTGSLKHLLKIAPNATVVGTAPAIKFLSNIVGFEFKHLVVKDGDSISLGNKTLKFIMAPNLHWPDTMFTYLEEDKLLFSCDVFGAHYCSEDMFDADNNDYYSAFQYYFDVILKPFSKFMLTALSKIENLEIVAVCPSHGPMLKKNALSIINLTEQFASTYLKKINPETKKVLIAYVSAYGFTKRMAELIAEGVAESGNIEVELIDIETTKLDVIDSLISQSCGIIIGSPTINQNILPQIYNMFAAISPIRDKGKFAAAFGSYGWSGEGVKIIEDTLTNLKLNVIREGLNDRFYPYHSEEKYKAFGKSIAEKIKEVTKVS